MGKKGGSTSSWLTAVKRAFRSPTKESTDNRRRGQNHDQDVVDDEEKKREKRRWIFRKPTSQEAAAPIQQKPTPPPADQSAAAAAEQRHAIAVAVATAAAAEAAVATAQAAVEVARLARPNYHAREHYAAIVIQTSFRGYLARRALRALKGLVKLQALVRGHNVRKQAKMTLRCMQALVRVQSRILDQRMRLSHEGSRKSTFSDTTSIIESRYLQDLSDRKSMQSREGSSSIAADDWDERPHTIEEVKAMLQQRKDAALNRQRNLSQQAKIWRNSGRSPSVGSEAELQDNRPPQQWLDRWMAAKPWDSSRARASTDHRDPIKTVEMDTSSQPYTYLASSNNSRRPSNQTHQRPSSPARHRSNEMRPFHHQSPIAVTPSPSRTRPVQVRSASPRSSCFREDYRSNSSQTPSLRSNYRYTGNLSNHQHGLTRSSNSSAASSAVGSLPNYMAATESARARSAPRQRPSTPERDGGNRGPGAGGCAKKRLSFPVPDPHLTSGLGQYPLRSPSFKSVSSSAYYGGLEQQSNYSSCYTESVIGCGGGGFPFFHRRSQAVVRVTY
ncbi:unnamed protein product [Linum tenue]|uniref:DUF4005 domain-containing protein n=1 Tax=Linum tenue TaxID=586396 RepID=A0AAV0RJD3_9ROSI|nr:unnamed protein product [Linum tenue]